MTKNLAIITTSALISMSAFIWVQASLAAGPDLRVTTWNPPLDTPIKLVNQYRQPNSDYSAGHRGVDYLVEAGQAVYAPFEGQIWFVGKVVDRFLVTMRHESGYVSEFEPVCTKHKQGDVLVAGQFLGQICEPEITYKRHCASAECLHFSIRKDGAYLSPLVLLGGLNPSRLFPTP
jgi:murein DD-endopeptidase MepM/ murein hydrolase activator NlpD